MVVDPLNIPKTQKNQETPKTCKTCLENPRVLQGMQVRDCSDYNSLFGDANSSAVDASDRLFRFQ